MKLSYFRLQARPFPTTPDPQFYYPATPHEAAVERLRQAIEDGEGITLLTGEPGTGKTLLAHLLLQRLGEEINSALITNCRFTARADLFRAVLFDLGRPYAGLCEQELRLALAEYLLDEFAREKRTVLILDEAQGLTPDLLEEVRLLGNLEAGRGKAVQSVLIALPSILDALAHPELSVLNQRLAVRVHLEALDLHESADYLLHQLRQAGVRAERVITDEAVSLLAANARGVPRLLNRYAHQALVLAEQAGADRVDAEAALEALVMLGVEPEATVDDFPAGMRSASTVEPASEMRITRDPILGASRTPVMSPGVPMSLGQRVPGSSHDPAWCSGIRPTTEDM